MGGSSQSTSVKIPAWLEDAAKANIAKANEIAKIGYTPYYGPDIAAMTAPQLASMQGTNQAAMAFGVPTADFNSGMPQAQDYGGMSAYSSGGLADQAFAELKERRPGQYDAIMAQFINPFTGAPATGGPGAGGNPGGFPGFPGFPGLPGFPFQPGQMPDRMGDRDFQSPTGGGGGGFSGLRDMFDGGGAGASGPDFQGGPLSGSLNRMGVNPVGQSGGGGMGRGK